MTPIFYTLKQLEQRHLTDLKYRMLKNRLTELISKGKIKVGPLLYKKSNRWHIHISLLINFQAVRKLKSHTKVLYTTELTINFDDKYDIQYYQLIGYTILNALDPHRSRYSIECSSMQNKSYHIHFATTASYEEIYYVLYRLERQLDLNIIKNKNTHISKICNHALYENYIDKACFGWYIW